MTRFTWKKNVTIQISANKMSIKFFINILPYLAFVGMSIKILICPSVVLQEDHAWLHPLDLDSSATIILLHYSVIEKVFNYSSGLLIILHSLTLLPNLPGGWWIKTVMMKKKKCITSHWWPTGWIYARPLFAILLLGSESWNSSCGSALQVGAKINLSHCNPGHCDITHSPQMTALK